MKSKQIKVMAVTAILMAFNIVLSSFGVPVPGGHMYLNDVMLCMGVTPEELTEKLSRQRMVVGVHCGYNL